MRVLLLLAAMASVGFALGISFDLPNDRESATHQESEAEVLYHKDYASIDEMMLESNAVIVRGTVGTGSTSVRLGDGVLFTDTSVLVMSVIRGDLLIPAATAIIVRQTGGQDAEGKLSIAGQRLLKPDEEVMLVLTYDKVRDRYWIIGGAHGYFQIVGGELIHANFTDSTTDLTLKWEGNKHPLAMFAKSAQIGNLPAAVTSE